ncbi:hypothetical protein CCHR01_02669 [Colletotrichum chrysophilum]|uniref:Uncharacterized protein n=1 Tax=Colletotrichum chrysophilum TaxID=1836956 RepID=A0AAD9AVC5_9PEZI|nr:hypothetical protein CCHR01_02669 [Colletotrichum chrysophilum]
MLNYQCNSPTVKQSQKNNRTRHVLMFSTAASFAVHGQLILRAKLNKMVAWRRHRETEAVGLGCCLAHLASFCQVSKYMDWSPGIEENKHHLVAQPRSLTPQRLRVLELSLAETCAVLAMLTCDGLERFQSARRSLLRMTLAPIAVGSKIPGRTRGTTSVMTKEVHKSRELNAERRYTLAVSHDALACSLICDGLYGGRHGLLCSAVD